MKVYNKNPASSRFLSFVFLSVKKNLLKSMHRKLVLWLSLVLMSALMLTSCGLFKSRGVKAHEKLERKLEKEAKKGHEKDLKTHYKSQSKAAQQMIKKMERKNKKWKKTKKRGN